MFSKFYANLYMPNIMVTDRQIKEFFYNLNFEVNFYLNNLEIYKKLL